MQRRTLLTAYAATAALRPLSTPVVAAGQLYGCEFVQITDLPVAQADIRTFEVSKAGQRVGLWSFDLSARAAKNSGAWMNEYRTQERFKGVVTPSSPTTPTS